MEELDDEVGQYLCTEIASMLAKIEEVFREHKLDEFEFIFMGLKVTINDLGRDASPFNEINLPVN